MSIVSTLEFLHTDWKVNRKKLIHVTNRQPEQCYSKENNIFIVDRDGSFVRKCAVRLKRSGFVNISTAAEFSEALSCIDFQQSVVLIVDISHVSPFEDFYSALQMEKFRGFKGRLVFTAETVRFRDLYTASVIEASDFWIKGYDLNIEKEVSSLLSRAPRSEKETLCPDSVADLGLFRSAGLTKTERRMIKIMTDGFPRQREIAQQHKLSTAYVNKVFSRIYGKLSPVTHVENPAQLAFLITVCSRFS